MSLKYNKKILNIKEHKSTKWSFLIQALKRTREQNKVVFINYLI